MFEMKHDKIISKKCWVSPMLTVLAPDDDRVRQAATANKVFGDAVRERSAKF